MLFILSFVAGMITAVTVVQNGQLAAFYGQYSASTITHLVGLIAVSAVCLVMRRSFPEKQKAKPWMFLGGVVGVGTLLFLNVAYTGAAVAAIVALGLLGQTLSSIAVDHFGLFGTQRTPFVAARCWAVLAVAAGAAVMIFPLGQASLIAVLCALGSGVTVVTARTINGKLAVLHGPMRASLMNYVTGLTTIAVLMLLLGRGEPMWTRFSLSPNVWMYLGGAVGVGLIVILNYTVPKMSSLTSTLLQFTGQISMGLLLDTLMTGAFSWRNLAGGVLVALGLLLDGVIGRRALRRAEPLTGEN